MSEKQFRRLLDLVYIGNWVLNSARGGDRIRVYDQVESLLFSSVCCTICRIWWMWFAVLRCLPAPSTKAASMRRSWHMRIRCFYEILAEELARRDMELEGIAAETPEGMVDLNRRIDAYLDEFEAHGTDNLTVEGVGNLRREF